MRRELSSARPATADQADGQPVPHRETPTLRSLAARKFVVGTAATAALAAAAGLGVAAPAMTAAADDAGRSATASAATAPGTNLDDTMDRTVATGLGSAPTGGAWSPWGATFSVSGGKAHMANVNPGVSARATLEGVQARDESVSVTFSVPTIPTSGTGSFFGVLLRRQANGDAVYARVKVSPGGAAVVSTKLITGSTTVDVGPATALPQALVAGRSYLLDAVATGGAATTVSVRAYPAGTTAPAWQTTGQANLNAAMATKGSVGVYAYASGSGAPFSVDIDAITGRDLSAPVTTSPTGTPTSSSPSSSPTSASPSSSPTSASPSSSPTSASPSSSPTSSSPSSSPTGSPSSSNDPEGGIGFASGTPAPPTTTPPSTPPTTPPTTTPPAPGKPGPDNTGVRPGSSLTVVNGNITAQAGQVLENLDIRGMVIARQPNVTIRNCIIRGETIAQERPLIDALGSVNLQITDTTIVPAVHSVYNAAGIWGKGFTLTRVDISDTVDGVDVFGSDVTVRDSWIHDLAWFASSPGQHGGNTHNDSIQMFGGARLTVTNTVLERTTGSVLQTTPTAAFGPIVDMTWSNNWIDGGGCSLNIWAGAAGTLAPITLTGNRFGTNQVLRGCAIIANLAKTPLVMSGNVWDANNLPVAVSRG